MAFVLLIDTAAATAGIGFANSEDIIAQQTNEEQKDHAAFVQPAIRQLARLNNLSLQDVEAVAVVNGPGSYTGLRVGLASAKGLCYALNKPLILINTLEAMALATIELFPDETVLHCPLVDARRMEVFTAVYNNQLETVLAPQPLILTENSFQEFLNRRVIFSGSGAIKMQTLINHFNGVFSQARYTLQQVNKLAQKACIIEQFADIAYSEPFYLKNFYIFSR